MPLGVGSGFWAAVIPVAATNLVTNPSLEYFGTTGYSALGGGATIGSTSYTQTYGAWSLQVNYLTTSEGAFYSAGTPTAGSYTMSANVRGTSGHTLRLIAAEATNTVTLGSVAVTATGAWQPVAASFAMPSGTGLQVLLRHTSPAADGTFYMDGLNITSGTFQTTHIDGDQDGCQWLGAPHASTSQRSGQSRAGGTIVALADLGWNVDQMPGVGVMALENSSQSYAVIDGAQFQRTRAAPRSFTLTGKPISGTTTADYHVTRRTIWDALKRDLVTPTQPVRLLYVGGQGTQQLDAYYDHGLELGNMDGPMAEDIAVSFVSTDPFWYAPTQQGTALSLQTSFGSMNFIASRDPLGRWGTLGASGTSVNHVVNDLAIGTDNTVIASGTFNTAGGTASGGIAFYTPSTNAWGTTTNGTANPWVRTLALAPNGTLYFGGNFTSYAGTTSGSIGYYAGGAFGSFTGYPGGGQVWNLLYNSSGSLFMVGEFTTIKGTTSPRIGIWNGAAFGSLVGQAGGTVDGPLYAVTEAYDLSIIFGGGFGSAGGTAMSNIGLWRNNAFGSMSTGLLGQGASTLVDALVRMPDGKIAIGGNFSTVGGIFTQSVGLWNGAGYSALGQGIGSGNGVNYTFTMAAGSDNVLYAAGAYDRAGSVILPDGAAKYVGGAWVPFDVDLGPSLPAGTSQIAAIAFAPTGTMYIGGNFAGAAKAASVAQVVNSGRAEAFPTLRMRNTSATGTARVFQLLNTTTGNGIYFGLVLLPGELATLDLTPGDRSFTSSFRGNIFGAILPGSNLAQWSLLPGTNTVSFFADVSSGLSADFFWPVRGWSADSGTLY